MGGMSAAVRDEFSYQYLIVTMVFRGSCMIDPKQTCSDILLQPINEISEDINE